MKTQITEPKAAAQVLSFLFDQIDRRWPIIWENLLALMPENKTLTIASDFARFNFVISVTSLNLRSLYDNLPNEQAERLFFHTLQLFEAELGDGTHFVAVANAIRKNMEAYNQGIIQILNPVQEMSKYLYFTIGLENIRQDIVDKPFFAPDPKIIEFLSNNLLFFSGKWESMNRQFEMVPE